jgi:hypothetical protein
MPTGKMRHGREPGSTDRRAYFFGHGAAQNPSWCDRILYGTADQALRCATDRTGHRQRRRERPTEGDGAIRCLLYDRFETGQCMVRSDHAAVIGMLEIDYAVSPPDRLSPVRRLPSSMSDTSQKRRDVHTAENSANAPLSTLAEQASFADVATLRETRSPEAAERNQSSDSSSDEVILLQRIDSDQCIDEQSSESQHSSKLQQSIKLQHRQRPVGSSGLGNSNEKNDAESVACPVEPLHNSTGNGSAAADNSVADEVDGGDFPSLVSNRSDVQRRTDRGNDKQRPVFSYLQAAKAAPSADRSHDSETFSED